MCIQIPTVDEIIVLNIFVTRFVFAFSKLAGLPSSTRNYASGHENFRVNQLRPTFANTDTIFEKLSWKMSLPGMLQTNLEIYLELSVQESILQKKCRKLHQNWCNKQWLHCRKWQFLIAYVRWSVSRKNSRRHNEWMNEWMNRLFPP